MEPPGGLASRLQPLRSLGHFNGIDAVRMRETLMVLRLFTYNYVVKYSVDHLKIISQKPMMQLICPTKAFCYSDLVTMQIQHAPPTEELVKVVIGGCFFV